MNRVLLLSIAFILILIPSVALASSGLARLTLTKGEVLLYDQESSDWVPAAPNTPVEEGDRIWCADGARAEIELKTGSVIRLGSKTTVDFVRLDEDAQQVYLGSGRLYARTLEADRDLQIDSEDATMSIGRKSRVHIDLIGSGDPDTEVSVVKGAVYVESSSGKTRVRSGEDLIFSENGAEVAPLNPPDEWEQWNEGRDRKTFKRKAEKRYLPEDLSVYEEELASNGEWVTIEEYGYVWRPTVSIGINWAPYQQGRWVWRGGSYIWIASEPWGWAPHHYGRWQHHQRWGWCWVPPRRGDVYWSPGYVAWADTGRDLAWVPLAPNEAYYGNGFYGSLSINITNIDRRSVARPITVYRNVTVKNAVTVVERNAFVRGTAKPLKGRPAEFNQQQSVSAPPQTRPSAREARMPQIRSVTTESKPPVALMSRSKEPLKERFPRLERERRMIETEKQHPETREHEKTSAEKARAVQQSVFPVTKTPPSRVAPSPEAQPTKTAPVPQTQPYAAPQPYQTKVPRTPDREQSSAQQSSQERIIKSPGSPVVSDTRSEGSKAGKERQTPAEAKTVAPAPQPKAKQVQPRRVWKISPKDASKEVSKGSKKDEKQEQKENKGQKSQKDREGK